MERYRIGVVIPAFNEASTIGSVTAKASHHGVPIVVDDGSTDETGELAAANGASVVRHAVNLGYDQALNSGFARAAELGCQYVVTMDADGQHDPSILEMFLKALDDGADVVVGIRDRRQRLAESIFAWVAAKKWGIRDPLCGIKAYRIGVYEELGHFDANNSIGTELTLFAVTNGKNIVQLPISTRDRFGEPRFGGRCSANLRILRALWVALFSQTNR